MEKTSYELGTVSKPTHKTDTPRTTPNPSDRRGTPGKDLATNVPLGTVAKPTLDVKN